MLESLDAATDLTFVARTRSARLRLEDAESPSSRLTRSDPEVLVRLGSRWRPGDGALLLAGVRRAVRTGARLTLEHRGAGGASLLSAAAAEHPGLRVRELRAGVGSAIPPERVKPLRWEHFQLPPSVPPADVVTAQPTRPGAPARPGAVAVTGGLGGIGLRLAARFSELGHPLWLIDQRPVSALPAADQHLLGAIAARVPLVVTHADTTRRPPPAPLAIEHLVHAAGELDLCPVLELTDDGLETAAVAKATGLAQWVGALAEIGLRSVVAYGSVESRRPHPLFAGYALANELLRREAERLQRRYPRIRIVTAEWSLWTAVGMAADSAGLAEQAGFAVVPPGWGAAATYALLDPHDSRSDGNRPTSVVLGGPQSSPWHPVRAVAGIGGSAHAPKPEYLNRLLRLCQPEPGAGQRHLPGTGGVLRALVRGRRVGTWRSPENTWAEPFGPSGSTQSRR